MSALRLTAAGLPIAALFAIAAPAQAPAPRFEGVWDLTWQTSQGPRRRGMLTLTRSGTTLTGEIRGPTRSATATGSANGPNFALSGSRMLVRYRIEGRVSGDRMEGVLKAVGKERRFTGARRP